MRQVRGRSLALLTIVMGGALVLSIGIVYLIGYLSYLLLAAAIAVLFLFAWLALMRSRHER